MLVIAQILNQILILTHFKLILKYQLQIENDDCEISSSKDQQLKDVDATLRPKTVK